VSCIATRKKYSSSCSTSVSRTLVNLNSLFHGGYGQCCIKVVKNPWRERKHKVGRASSPFVRMGMLSCIRQRGFRYGIPENFHVKTDEAISDSGVSLGGCQRKVQLDPIYRPPFHSQNRTVKPSKRLHSPHDPVNAVEIHIQCS
jgi:hypothetical protein